MSTALDVRTALLNVARGHQWVRETNGANRGELVDRMIATTGLDPRQRLPWCAAFVAYVGKLVLADQWPIPPFAGCVSLHDWAKARGLATATPEPGAVFLQYGQAGDGAWRYRHCGFLVERVTHLGAEWHTIEGNTNEAGSPEGVGVFARRRTFGKLDRFIPWWALLVERTPIVTPLRAA